MLRSDVPAFLCLSCAFFLTIILIVTLIFCISFSLVFLVTFCVCPCQQNCHCLLRRCFVILIVCDACAFFLCSLSVFPWQQLGFCK